MCASSEAFGALHHMLAALPPERQNKAWDEVELALCQFEEHGSFIGPRELLVDAATR